MSEAFDFSRYAPVPRLVHDEPPQKPGELEQTFKVVGEALRLICECLRIAAIIIRERTANRLAIAYYRFISSLQIAWAVSGLGWGCSAGLFCLLIFAR